MASLPQAPALPIVAPVVTRRPPRWRWRGDRWGGGAALLTGIIALPLLAILFYLGQESVEWSHLAETVLVRYLTNTLILVVGVSLLVLVMGVVPAWLVTTCEFRGRRVLSWALILPLAIPTYIAAFVFYQGPEAAIPMLIQVRMRFGVEAFLLAEQIIRYGLLIVMLAAVLYPYVYLACCSAFSRQSRALIEAARCLGDSPTRSFLRAALPMARPGIVAGVALVIMEVINDYGAVHFFGVPTLTEGVFRTWFGMGDKVAALRLAGIMMIVVAALLMLEQWLRGRARYVEADAGSIPMKRLPLGGGKAALALLVCSVPVALGFLFPVGRLVHWAGLHLLSDSEGGFPAGLALVRGFGLALATAVVVTALAALFMYAVRLRESRLRRLLGRIAGMGYATPGAVIAVGVLVVFGTLDRLELPLLPLVSGTLFVIAFAYTVRFFAIPLQLARAGLERIGKPLEEASRLLGHPPLRTFLRVDLPLLRAPLIAAGMLLFVDILKELPLTLILRPANFETLATTAYSLASEARLQACAVPALLIVAVGAIGLLVMNRWLQPPSPHE